MTLPYSQRPLGASVPPITPRQVIFKTLSIIREAAATGHLDTVEKQLETLAQSLPAGPAALPDSRATVFKVDEERRMVYGWASIVTKGGVPVEDKQEDVISVDDIREAAHNFIDNRNLGRMHKMLSGIGEIRESVIIDKAMQEALGIDLGMEGWWVGAYVKDEDTWAKVRDGTLRAFSIGGTGVREPDPLIVTKALRYLDTRAGRTPEGRVALFREALTAIRKCDAGEVSEVHSPAPLRGPRRKRKRRTP